MLKNELFLDIVLASIFKVLGEVFGRAWEALGLSRSTPKGSLKSIQRKFGFSMDLGGSWKALGRIWGGFWEAFGRVWEALGHSWGLSELFFVVFAGGGCLLLFFTVFLLISEAFAELCWALLGFAA